MRKQLILAAIGAALAVPGMAKAQDFPNWRLSAICASGDDTCPRFEARTRGELVPLWSTLPQAVRTSCLAETAGAGKSYRLLYDCLVQEMRRLARLAQVQRPPEPDPSATPQPETAGQEPAGAAAKLDASPTDAAPTTRQAQ